MCRCHEPTIFGHVSPCELAHPQVPSTNQTPIWYFPWSRIPEIDVTLERSALLEPDFDNDWWADFIIDDSASPIIRDFLERSINERRIHRRPG